jgi:hypothetical protein
MQMDLQWATCSPSSGWLSRLTDGSSQGASRQCQLSTAALALHLRGKKKGTGADLTNHNAPDKVVAGKPTTYFVVRLATDARFVTALSLQDRLRKPSFLLHPIPSIPSHRLKKVIVHILPFTSESITIIVTFTPQNASMITRLIPSPF